MMMRMMEAGFWDYAAPVCWWRGCAVQTVTSTPSTFPLVPSCPRLSLLSIIPLPSCALFALSSCPLSTLGTPSQKNILSFGHCLNWRRPPTKIYVDLFLAANFPPNQCNREFLRWLSSGEPSNVIFWKKLGFCPIRSDPASLHAPMQRFRENWIFFIKAASRILSFVL